ncbi:hypothetical protein CONPUDRAFT_169169 [Coniophora puteana RWD-64-598 SS2]|uniref:Uncharacterized protein n=1 Tax=Coniophora puteana (strain RWD-64-598) TaxID=741705 RepID=A0A5M3M9H0_CONPW|nr:uncharacterized protein CONPUDRAFT_169169 [Coniophora puteana RWD-64-598 SS2]EIW75932.1 hypothetical protein CONPUDRAFT_169169 [Coniophora puteana RWD-64-598 SS2]
MVMTAANSCSGVPPETPEELFADSINFIGDTVVAGALYGIMTAIAGLCAHTFIRLRRRRTRRRLAFLLGYVAVLWVCGSLIIVGLAISIKTVYVDLRLTESKPFADFSLKSPSMVATVYSNYLAIILADGMMVWRFKVIWRDSFYYRWLIPMPVLLWLANNVVVGLLSSMYITDSTHYLIYAQTLIVPAFVLSMVLNLYTTLLMAGRLVMFRWRFKQNEIPGSSIPSSRQYTDVAAMLVESCALYTFFSVLFFGFYLSKSPLLSVMATILPQTQMISPLLIMLRISRGIAWTGTTSTETTTRQDVELQFQNPMDVEGQDGKMYDGPESPKADSEAQGPCMCKEPKLSG